MRFCRHCGVPVDGRTYCTTRCREAYKNAELRAEFIRAYGGRCTCSGCGVSTPEFLSLEHVKNDGAAHRRASTRGRGGVAIYRVLKNLGWPKDGYRLLCYNCNLARAHFGRCPHEYRVIS